MKKITLLLLVLSISFHQQLFAQDLKSEFLFDLELNLSSPQVVGPLIKGTRMIFPFKSGTVKGDKINGTILESGADWGLIFDSTTFKIDVRATIKTDDDALIYITYWGYNYTPKSTGKGDESYFRTSVSFETSSPKYAWLNHIVAVGFGRFPGTGKVAYRIYAIK